MIVRVKILVVVAVVVVVVVAVVVVVVVVLLLVVVVVVVSRATPDTKPRTPEYEPIAPGHPCPNRSYGPPWHGSQIRNPYKAIITTF